MKLRLLLPAAAALALAAAASASPPRVDGRAFLVRNAATGEILYSYHARQRLPIASITKLMTALVALDHARLGDVVTIGRRAAAVGESTIGLRPGERLTVRDLLEAALVQSANDAADALADYVGRGSRARFVALMNGRARELGLTDTHFVRPDGLDVRGHLSSARDVTALASEAMRNPAIRDIVNDRTATISGGRRLRTRNDLLSTFPNLLGVKTGHTRGAGWSEVAAARGRGVTIYATLLGSPSRGARNRDLTALLSWGLRQYRVVPVVSAARVYATAQTPFGRAPLQLVAPRTLVRVARVGRPFVERVVAPAAVRLPVARGERLGEVRIFLGGRLVAVSPLVAARSVGRPGLGGRTGYYARRAVHHVWTWVTKGGP